MLVVALLAVLGAAGVHGQPPAPAPSCSHSSSHAPDDTFHNVSETVACAGYAVQEYQVVTQDGYVLFAQRVPPSKGRNVTSRGPVYLMPGLTCTTSVYVAMQAPFGLPYVLADAGYDVWLINQRCRPYPTHIKYKPSEPEMWNWSIDEIAELDMRAGLDLIYNVTGHRVVEAFIGHSQGGLIGWASFSRYPELANRVKLFIPLAGPSYLPPKRSDAAPSLGSAECPKHKGWPGACDGLLGLHSGAAINWEGCQALGTGCNELACLACGCESKETFNHSRLVVFMGHYPSVSSEKNMEHWDQLEKSGFQMFDYGTQGNQAHYNSSAPPIYDVSKIMTPVAVFYGSNDKFVEPSTVETALTIVPKSKLKLVTKLPFGHLDFILNVNAPAKLYSTIVSLLNENA